MPLETVADMDDKDIAMVIFQPSARRGTVKKGVNLIEASRQLGVDIETLCGEKGICGKCRVRIEEGFFEKFAVQSGMDHCSPWNEEEGKFISPSEREQGFRLACLAEVLGDILVFVPEESRAGKQVVSKAARPISIEKDPAVKGYYVEMIPPSFEEPTADFERLCQSLEKTHGLKDLNCDLVTLKRLPIILREADWKVTASVWMDREIIRLVPGNTDHRYGLAVDIGTTTVAGYLCDLTTGEVLVTESMMNPQCKYGEDVMSRITFHMMNDDGLQRMGEDITECLNTIVKNACKTAQTSGLRSEDIEDMTIVGNTAMHHILLQIDPQYAGVAPFPPVIHKSLDIKARDLGIKIHPSAYIHVLPIEAGFVGADNIGVLLAEEPYKGDEMQLIIDIGTNGELVLGNRKKMISSSCATGPALEGAQIAFGMRAAPGAIERIEIDPETHEVDYKVIGRDTWKSYSKPEEMETKGICGSGILDVFAELYRAGIVLTSGAFSKNQKSDRFRRNPETNQPEFVIAWAKETSIGRDVVITQKDVRQIQLAKGALYCGCKLMMRRMGIDRVDRVKIAGAFGTHVDPKKALIMGLFPDCPVERIVSIGNAAGDGARVALLNRNKREEANWVARNVEYIELTIEKDFQTEFMEAMQIPHMKDRFPNAEAFLPPEVLKDR